jgi:hypothetical protein
MALLKKAKSGFPQLIICSINRGNQYRRTKSDYKTKLETKETTLTNEALLKFFFRPTKHEKESPGH